MLRTRLVRVAVFSLLATALATPFLAHFSQGAKVQIRDRAFLDFVLERWPAVLLAAPVAWWASRGRIQIDRVADTFRFGSYTGKVREIEVIWLDHRLGQFLDNFHEHASLLSGLAEGREVWIVGTGLYGNVGLSRGLEDLGYMIARFLEVPLQRRVIES